MPIFLAFSPRSGAVISSNSTQASLELARTILTMPILPNRGCLTTTEFNASGQLLSVNLEIAGISVCDAESYWTLVHAIENKLHDSNLPFFCSSGRYTDAILADDAQFSHQKLMPTVTFNARLMTQLDLDEKNLPAEFICPLSGSIIDNPVYDVRAPGQKYDKEFLMYWLNKSRPRYMPDTRLIYQPYFLANDLALKQQITEYLHQAIQDAEQENIKKILAKCGLQHLDPTDKKTRQQALLYLAAHGEGSDGRTMLVSILRYCPVDFCDENDVNRNTVLHLALIHQRYDLAIVLLQSGAKLTLANSDGKTASQLIMEIPDASSKAKIINVMQELGLHVEPQEIAPLLAPAYRSRRNSPRP